MEIVVSLFLCIQKASPGGALLSVLRERRPIEDHFLWRNFVYDPADFDSNWFLTNGASIYNPWWPIRLLEDPKCQFTGPATNPLPLAFSSTNSPWLIGRGVYCGWWPCGPETLGEVGLEMLASEEFLLPEGVRNVYGLPLLSVQFPPTPTLVAGGPPEWLMVSTLAYPQAAVPDLSTADYYFISQTPYFRFGSARPPLPGSPDFTVTNTSPLLIASVGQPYAVAGWAKQAILNGYANRFGYLEQYFDKAYRMTVGGVVTTNQTGLLSPYGEFFPTEPGPTALVTMPDVETGQPGTSIVHVIKLQTDVNHDGVMDTTYAGPDNTSAYRPFSFWANNDHDEPASGSNPDRDLNNWGVPPDYTYGAIRCQRNLEDFARLWICGMPTLPADYTVQLGWSSISSGSPRIRLYWASESNGGIGYLTNATIAAQQIAQHNTPIGDISPTSTLSLPANVFSNGLTKYFLFEAGAVGSGQLTLTISQGGTNTIAQTSAWFDFHDITDFYEHAIVTNVLQDWPDMVQTNLTSGFQVYSYAKVNPGDAKQLAVFVHGWRMGVWDWYNFSETMFKRLWRTKRHRNMREPEGLTAYSTRIIPGFCLL